MSVSRIGAGAATATTITIPAGHQAGDLLLMFAFRSGSTTLPTIPAGWTSLLSPAGANTCCCLLAFKIALSSSETSGTWTSATTLVCHVYRGQSTQHNASGCGTPINTAGTGTVLTYAAITTPISTGGKTWLAAFAAHRTATNVSTAFTGMTNTVNGSTCAGFDTNAGALTFASATATVNASSGWETIVVEILPETQNLQNYLSPRAPDGISTGEKIR